MIFNSQKNHLMSFKQGGLDYLKNMSRGYISHLRGGDPITFANLKMSWGLYSTQSENNNEIYSVSIDFLAKRFLFVLSIELVKHFLKMNSSS